MNILFGVLFFISSIVMLFFYKTKLSRVSSFSVFVIISLIFNYFGFFYLTLGVDEFRLEYIEFDSILLLQFLVVSFVFFILLFSYQIFSVNSSFLKTIVNNNIFCNKSIVILCFVFSFFIFVYSLSSYISLIGFENITLFSVLLNNADPTLARSNTSSAIDGFYFYQLGFNDFGLLCLGFLIILKKHFRFNFTRHCFFFFQFFLFFSLIVAFLFTGEKSKIFDLFLFYFLIIFFTNGKSSIFYIFLYFVSVLLILVFSYVTFMGSSGFDVFYEILSRLLGGQLQSGYHHIEYYFFLDELYYGATFPNPFGFFPFVPITYTQILMDWVVGPEFIDGTKVVASMPTFFWGELLLNFDFLGMFIFVFFVGFYFRFIDNIFKGVPCDSLFLVFYCWLIVHYKNLAFTGISNYVFDIKLLSIILFYFFVFFVFYFLKKRGA